MPQPKETLVSRQDMVVVIIDIQDRLASAMSHRDRVVASTGKLARVAHLVEAPVIVTRQYPKGLGATVEDLEQVLMELAQDGAKVMGVDKTAFCCASEDEFVDALSATGRRQVVLCGMETHICVTQTALALAHDGYQVQVAADACCSRDDSNHEVALERLRAAGVIVTVSESVMYEVVGRAGTPEFKSLLGIVKD